MPDSEQFSRRLLAAIALVCITGLSISLYLQHVVGLQPCAWCVLQRGIYVLIAVVCALAATASRSVVARAVGAALAVGLAVMGLTAALFHQFVAARPGGCGVTIADKFLMVTRLYEHVPWFFDAPASCDQANAPLLGVPFALWSATLFTMLGGASVVALMRLLKARAMR